MHLPISDGHDVLSNALDVSVGMVDGGQPGREMTVHFQDDVKRGNLKIIKVH